MLNIISTKKTKKMTHRHKNILIQILLFVIIILIAPITVATLNVETQLHNWSAQNCEVWHLQFNK